MKKIKLLLVTLIGLLLMAPSVNADTTKPWNTVQPNKRTESNDIQVKCEGERDYSWGKYNYEGDIRARINVTIIIPEDYSEKQIVISPKVFKAAAEAFGKEYLTIGNGLQAGDTIEVNYKIINNSKYTYYYDKNSFKIFTDGSFNLGESNTKTFNGLTISKNEYFRRVYNTALAALIPNSRGTLMTNETVGAALSAKNYNGINDLGKYYLDFYNEKYNVNHTRLDEFSYGVIREIFSNNNADPMKIASQSIGDMPSIPKVAFKKVEGKTMEEKLANLGMSNIHEFIMSEYSKVCGYEITSYDNLCEEAETDFFSSGGMEKDTRDFVIETEEDLLALGYDYFYNKVLSYDLNHSVKNLTYGNNTQHYSIGEYMRNEGKGDDVIAEAFGTLEPGSTYELNETLIKIDGNYTRNIYLDYEFTANIEMSFSVKTGTLISKYIDEETGEEIASRENTEGLVGDNYETKEKEIDGYELVNVTGAETGNYIEGEIEVIYIYRHKKGTLIVNYVDSDGNKLTEEIITTNKVGENYTTIEKEFEGYTFIAVEGPTTGEYIDGTIYVTYYYDKNIGTGDITPPQTGVEASTLVITSNTIAIYKKED